MNDRLYVSTDSEGVEHTATDEISWHLPPSEVATDSVGDQSLLLRTPSALLEVLEEVIWQVEPSVEAKPDHQGVVAVRSARLVARTSWTSESATLFALDCAEHVLDESDNLTFPDGTQLKKIVSDAREMLAGISSNNGERLGYFARLNALRRLHRSRVEAADMSLTVMLEDEQKDLDALDDPKYASIVPVIDAVLAGIEALHQHVVPHFYEILHEGALESEESKNLDRKDALSIPTVQMTPFGPAMVGGGPNVLRYEPSGKGAREAAQHARMAARDRQGESGENTERQWQAERLKTILEESFIEP